MVCAALVTLFFLPGLNGGFIFDDGFNIQFNTALHIENWSIEALQQAIYSFAPGGGSRILAELTFALDYWRGGLDPSVFKATNIAIHALTTFVLALFFRLVLLTAGFSPVRAMQAALVMALIWALHPLQVSSVLYVVQRMQTLGTLFLLLALWAYLKMRMAQIEGERSRKFAVLTGLFWVLALASKEDSAILPVYTWLLELTVLRFRAKRPALANVLRKGYSVLVVIGFLVYCFVVVPHYWSWDAYAGRDFSTFERLLTQGRMLAMYLGQILWPMPGHMPFYYDQVEVSRGWIQPLTTLPSLLLVFGLLTLSWLLRFRRPLFSLGVLLFFAGHFVTSNVVPLELAFEHRNHLPLIGAVLALADLCAMCVSRWRLSAPLVAVVCTLLVASLTTLTALRSHTWGDPLRLAENLTKIAPNSARAWNDLCLHYFRRSNKVAGSPDLAAAISVCEKGAKIPYSMAALSNLVAFKSIQGTVTQRDWDDFLNRLEVIDLNAENKNVVWIMMRSVIKGDPLDTRQVLKAVDIIADRAGFDWFDYIRIGYFVLEKTDNPDEAYRYFFLGVRYAPEDDVVLKQLAIDLRAHDREHWLEGFGKGNGPVSNE